MVANPATKGFYRLEESGFLWVSELTFRAVPEALHLDPAGEAACLALPGPVTLVRLDAAQLLPDAVLDLPVRTGPEQTSQHRTFKHQLPFRVSKNI